MGREDEGEREQGYPTGRFGEYLLGRPVVAYDFQIKVCARKTGVFFSSNFRNMENVMPVVFGEIKMSFSVRKIRAASIIGKATAVRKFG